jgi:hypothetical protein
MTRYLLNASMKIALAAACMGTLINGTTAGSFTRGCAARDLQILMLIEERESANAISTEKLSDAMLTMMSARMVCYEGHVVDALTMYDGIAASLTPDVTRTSRSQRMRANRDDLVVDAGRAGRQ